MTERFVPVAGYEDLYVVGDLGTVMRVPDKSNSYRGKTLKPSLNASTRYPVVTLTRNGRMKTYTVHSLVMRSFSPTTDARLEVRHKDGGRSDPSLSNLEWGTRAENVADKIRHGRSGLKITSGIADDIKQRIASGLESMTGIATRFGVSPSTICDIKAGRYWNHV